jgi:hypothetical protein
MGRAPRQHRQRPNRKRSTKAQIVAARRNHAKVTTVTSVTFLQFPLPITVI